MCRKSPSSRLRGFPCCCCCPLLLLLQRGGQTLQQRPSPRGVGVYCLECLGSLLHLSVRMLLLGPRCRLHAALHSLRLRPQPTADRQNVSRIPSCDRRTVALFFFVYLSVCSFFICLSVSPWCLSMSLSRRLIPSACLSVSVVCCCLSPWCVSVVCCRLCTDRQSDLVCIVPCECLKNDDS